MAKAVKTRASKQAYISPAQPPLPGFESPFSRHLNPLNRWIILANKIPWDELVGVYQKQMNNTKTGADGSNPRVVIGSFKRQGNGTANTREHVYAVLPGLEQFQ